MRNFILEGKKIAKPVLVTTVLLTLLTCILSCTLYREYTLHFELDPWEIGTEFLSLLFPLFVTIPICWQLYYERRDRFLTYTLPRIGKGRYLVTKWCACAVSAFIIMMVPYFVSALFALYVRAPQALWPLPVGYSHVFLDLYAQRPVLYALALSAWKGLLGVLTMTFGFVLALYGGNIFVILTGPFIYVILENFFWAILGMPGLRFVTAFEPTSMSAEAVHTASFIAGPALMCVVMGLAAFFFQKGKNLSIYQV
ncbi:hypothetical protein CE91St43_28290 [Oscillospiraceae bacterium]|nr:hypothetical protein CE91St43_28290 [Oscillospiraceae bacterium]